MADLNPGLAGLMSTIAGLFPGGQAIQAAQAISGRGSGGLLGLAAKGVGVDVSNIAPDVGQQIGQGIGVVTGAVDDALSGILGGLPGADATPQDVGLSGPQDIGGPSTLPTPATPALPDPTTASTITTRESSPEQDINETLAAVLPVLSPELPLRREPETETVLDPSVINLPPVFTEQDARALLQGSGQLPLAGIV